MHEVPSQQDMPSQRDTNPPSERREQRTPGPLSQSDPAPERSTGRVPIWLIVVIVLLVAGIVVLHLTGVAGPGSH